MRRNGAHSVSDCVEKAWREQSRDIDGGDMPALCIVAGKTWKAARWSVERSRSGMVQPEKVQWLQSRDIAVGDMPALCVVAGKMWKAA